MLIVNGQVKSFGSESLKNNEKPDPKNSGYGVIVLYINQLCQFNVLPMFSLFYREINQGYQGIL